MAATFSIKDNNDNGESVREVINILKGIWKYAALDYHIELAREPVANRDIEKANEYAIILRALWDECDKHSIQTLESCICELDGKLIGKIKGELIDYKVIRTQLEEYLATRLAELYNNPPDK